MNPGSLGDQNSHNNSNIAGSSAQPTGFMRRSRVAYSALTAMPNGRNSRRRPSLMARSANLVLLYKLCMGDAVQPECNKTPMTGRPAWAFIRDAGKRVATSRTCNAADVNNASTRAVFSQHGQECPGGPQRSKNVDLVHFHDPVHRKAFDATCRVATPAKTKFVPFLRSVPLSTGHAIPITEIPALATIAASLRGDVDACVRSSTSATTSRAANTCSWLLTSTITGTRFDEQCRVAASSAMLAASCCCRTPANTR